MIRIQFVTTTMQSLGNGPANFAMNLFKNVDHYRDKLDIHFVSEDVDSSTRSTRVFLKYSKYLSGIGMIVRAIEYSMNIKKRSTDIIVWNFSVLAWFHILTRNSRNAVFVNDSFSLGSNLSQLTYRNVRSYIFGIFEKYVCTRADVVFTNSMVLKKQLMKEYHLPTSKVVVLHKGIDLNLFTSYKENFEINSHNRIKVGFVKSDYVAGGLELLCDALTVNKGYHYEIHIIGPTIIDARFMDRYSEIRFKVYGKLNKGELFAVLQKVDFYCVPSVVEAFGQSNIEAMYMQIPTVIIPTENQLQLHDQTYCWIPSGIGAHPLNVIIEDLINASEDQRKNKSKLAKKAIKNKFDIRTTIEAMFKTLEKIV